MQTMVCSETSLRTSSKSSIARSLDYCRGMPSPISVGLVQERDIPIHPLLQRGEVGVVACFAQVFDLGLGEILVLIADRRRHVDIFDVRRVAERTEHGGDQITEAARLAGAYIEDARHRRRIEQPTHDRDRVIHIDEVAFLLAVADAVAMRLEQMYRFAGLRVLEALADQARH